MGFEIENAVQEVIHSFGGIKSSLPHGLMQAPDAEEMLNFVSRRGRLRKLWGASLYYNSGFGAGEIKWLEYFRSKWIFQHGAVIAKELTESSADFITIGSMNLGADNKVSSEKWENRIYLTNGVENRYFEDPGDVAYNPADNFLTLGLIPPGNGGRNWDGTGVFQPDLDITEVAHVGGALPDATYGYVVTWWDANRKIESLPNGAQVGEDGLWRSFAAAFGSSNIDYTGLADKALRVGVAAMKAAGYDLSRVTHFILYRGVQSTAHIDSVSGFTFFPDFKRVADPNDALQEPLLRIANDFYDDTTLEVELGELLDESLSPPPSGLYYQGKGNKETDASAIGPRFIKFFRDQLWLFGIRLPGTKNGTELQPDAISAKNISFARQDGIAYASTVDNHEYWTFDYNIGRSTGQRDTGMAEHNNTLMFFKERSAFYLNGTSPENYVIVKMDANRGYIAPDSIRETTKGVVGLGVDGFVLFDGIAPGKLISDTISDIVARINPAAIDKITSSFDTLEEKYECHVPLDEFTWNSHVIVFDCKLFCWEVTTRAGGAVAFGISSRERQVSLLGNPRNGRLYDTSDLSKVTFDGQTIHGKWRSKAFDFGRPGELKSVQVVEITARMVLDCRLTIDLIPDFGQGDSATVEDIGPDVRGDRWAEDAADDIGMKWNEGQWSKGTEKKKFTVLIQAIGKNFNLVVRNSDKDASRASFEIEEIIIHASMLSGEEDD